MRNNFSGAFDLVLRAWGRSIREKGRKGKALMTNLITPVILCGGSGTRLWPLSRKSYPKQFVEMVGDGSLFQQSACR